jgi:hypothetical protein
MLGMSLAMSPNEDLTMIKISEEECEILSKLEEEASPEAPVTSVQLDSIMGIEASHAPLGRLVGVGLVDWKPYDNYWLTYQGKEAVKEIARPRTVDVIMKHEERARVLRDVTMVVSGFVVGVAVMMIL